MVGLVASGPRPAGGGTLDGHGGEAGGREPRPALQHGVAAPARDLRRGARNSFTQSMSRKGNCIDNGATEQVFCHLKDEFYKGRDWETF